MIRWIKYLWMRLTIPTVKVKVDEDGRVPVWRAVCAVDPDINTHKGAMGAVALGRVSLVWVSPTGNYPFLDPVHLSSAPCFNWETRIDSWTYRYILYVGKTRAWVKHIK